LDPNPDATFTFSLACTVAGTDDASFNISGADLRTSASFDFEAKNVYEICIRVANGVGATLDQSFIITIMNVNEAPTGVSLSGGTVDENQPVNTLAGTLSATDLDAGAAFTFSLGCAVAGADDASFNINGTGVQTSAVFDFETKPSYAICIRVTDQGGLSFDKNFNITVGNINEGAVDIALSVNTVDENQPVNTVIGILSATDPDVGATFTFSLSCTVAGVDDASFNISGTNLRASVVFNFEAKPAYVVCIRATDQGGLSFDKHFAVTVKNVNEAPSSPSLSNSTIDENRPANSIIGTLSATDPDAGAALSFSLTCAVAGGDDSSFNISGVTLHSSAVFDFEAKTSYTVCVRVADQGGLSFDKIFTVMINDLNEAPTGISQAGSSIDENQPANSLVGILSATDPDEGSSFTFSLACAVAGADDASFNISGANLQSSSVFDFEAKTSYSICVRATDQGGLSFDQAFTVTVNNINEAPGDLSLTNATIDENLPDNTIVGTLSAVDPDAGDTLTFSLACVVAGADDASFNISGANLQTSKIFDFESKSSYSICVRVTDVGGLSFDQNFTVNVNDVAEITNTPGSAAGRGSVGKGQEKASIHLDVQFAAGDTDPTGTLTFMDHSAKLRLKATSFTLLYINSSHAVITGLATVDKEANIAFTMDVYDNGDGTNDAFVIQIPGLNGYTFQGTLSKGDLTVALR
jgi:hypothetical protein